MTCNHFFGSYSNVLFYPILTVKKYFRFLEFKFGVYFIYACAIHNSESSGICEHFHNFLCNKTRIGGILLT